MGLLDSILADDAQFAFADPDGFAEPVMYLPGGGSPRTVNLVIDRDPPTDIQGTDAATGFATAFMPRHETNGTLAIDTGRDAFQFAPRQGGVARTFKIANIISQDPGGWMLALRGPSA